MLSKDKPFLKLIIILLIATSCGSPAGDGEVTDGITNQENRIFITSQSYSGNLGGLTGADAKCQALASAAGLERTYKAILGTDLDNAVDRLEINGPVYIFNSETERLKVTELAANLWDADGVNLFQAINRDENANVVSNKTPWTGSDSEGYNNGSVITDCQDWTSSSGSDNGTVGSSDETDGFWLENGDAACSGNFPLICISQ